MFRRDFLRIAAVASVCSFLPAPGFAADTPWYVVLVDWDPRDGDQPLRLYDGPDGKLAQAVYRAANRRYDHAPLCCSRVSATYGERDELIAEFQMLHARHRQETL